MTNEHYALTALGIVCALGNDGETVLRRALAGDTSGMRAAEGVLPSGESSPFGTVMLPENPATAGLSRCERLTAAAYAQIAEATEALKCRVGAARIGVVLGTSNSAMEEFTRNPDRIDMALPARFLRDLAGVGGAAYVVSTACSSSAKAFASARRLIASGCCDAVLTGGVDAFTGVVLNGFYALEALSTAPARPLCADRTGINLGEGAAIFILERGEGPVRLLGVGESSDAYHLTAPEPEGRGAAKAMRAALDDAGLEPSAIDYINLHGTGTTYNDKMEANAVVGLFGTAVSVSSTKALVGHTLGAAGAIEAALCWLMLKAGAPMLPHVPREEPDPALPPLRTVPFGDTSRPRTVLSASFAFGGSNAAVILGRPEARRYAMEELLPHRRPMILIDGYDPDTFSEAGVTAFFTVRESDVFYDAALGGTAPCTALEYIAQAVACYVGLVCRRDGTDPSVGFVLGSRALTLRLPRFVVGERYTVAVAPEFSDGQFASFSAVIRDGAGAAVAEATLNVFRPDDAEAASPVKP